MWILFFAFFFPAAAAALWVPAELCSLFLSASLLPIATLNPAPNDNCISLSFSTKWFLEVRTRGFHCSVVYLLQCLPRGRCAKYFCWLY